MVSETRLIYAIGGWSAVTAALRELAARVLRGVAPPSRRCIMGAPVHPWLHCGRDAGESLFCERCDEKVA